MDVERTERFARSYRRLTTGERRQVDACRAANTERKADNFAVESLMPKTWLLRDLAKIGADERVLARRYHVSRQAMQIRLRELGVKE